ncbi:MAG: IS66 family transposase [Bacteroidota bacterium]
MSRASCLRKQCSCGHKNVGEFPAEVNAPIQYGPRVKSYVSYLRHWQLIPIDRTAEVLKDCFDIAISQGTIENITEEFARRCYSTQQSVLAHLKQVPVKHLDETGLRVKGKLYWLHVLSDGAHTHYRIRAKRKDLIEELNATIVHDHWQPYFQYEGVKHALCNAHHLRELKALFEYQGEAWARAMMNLLQLISRVVSKNTHDPPKEVIARIKGLYDKIVCRGLAYHESLPKLKQSKLGRTKRRKGHNLLLRFSEKKAAVLRCLTDPDVPFSNNIAERDLRMTKVRQKISGCFRTYEGAEQFCTARGFLATARKKGKNIIQAIQELYPLQNTA